MKQLKAWVPSRFASALASIATEAGASAVDISAHRDRQGRVSVVAYCEDDAADALRESCRVGLREIARRARVPIAPVFRIEAVRSDWQTSWTQVLPPSRLAPGLVLVADGVNYQAAKGERVLRLEPGLYFGFGEHPTTQLICEWITGHCGSKTVLDVGCGTGVLAFVAAFSGATSVLGIDIDAPSVESAKRNAIGNGWQAQCTFSSDALEAVSGEYEVVLANIDAKTLTLLAGELCRVLVPGGQIALTGVLSEQAEDVRQAFSKAGVPLAGVAERAGWVLLTNAPATPP